MISSTTTTTVQDADYLQPNDCFVDASDVLLEEEDEDYLDEKVPNIGLEEQDEHTIYSTTSNNNDNCRSNAELVKNLGETAHILRLALSNEFNLALEMCEPRASHELYSGLAHATLCFLRAGLTLERADLETAQESVQNSMELSNRTRRQMSTASMLARFLTPYSRSPNYDSYTDWQIHAELVSAESMLLNTLISFLADQSVICLVKGAFRIRACHQRYKECLDILATRTCWGSNEARRHFESGVRMGNGIFNLLMSYLPRRVLKFLEYVGFSGSRSTGISELENSIELADGLRSVLSALVILAYHSYVENLFGLGLYDADKVRYLNDKFLATYRNSAFFLLFQGRYNQMMGNLDEALISFQQCIDAQNDWKQFHSICHWEMMWCHAVQMQWTQAAHYAHLLRNHSKWSPASYTYQYASFLYAQLVQDQRDAKLTPEQYEEKLAQVNELMASVPSLRIRYAGKTIPADKFAIERSIKFCRQKAGLAMLPAMEFLYIWNIFCILKNNQQQVAKIMKFIEEERDRFLSGKQLQQQPADTTGQKFDINGESDCEQEENYCQNDNYEDLCLISLLQGMCQKLLGREVEAEQSFRMVIDNQEKILHKQEKFLVAHAAMELTLLKLDLKQYDEARELIKSTRSNYTGYLLETIVHFRLHAASRVIRLATATPAATTTTTTSATSDGQSETLSTCPSSPKFVRPVNA